MKKVPLLSFIMNQKEYSLCRQNMEETMKKAAPCILILLLCLFICGSSSCHGPQYEEEEKELLEEQGRELMGDWLNRNMEGAEVTSVDADINMVPSGPQFLTNFVYGTFRNGGESGTFCVNLENGQVYLEDEHAELLSGVCADFVIEALGLADTRDSCQIVDLDASLCVVKHDYRGGKASSSDDYVNLSMLPGELVLALREAGGKESEKLRQFVLERGQRDLIRIAGTIQLPEELQLESFDMAFFLEQREKNGLYFAEFYLSDSFENSSTYGWYTDYNRYRFVSLTEPDIRIRMLEESWVQKERKGTAEVSEEYSYDPSALKMKRTRDGCLVEYTDAESRFPFSLYADEDSEFRRHEYHVHEDRQAYLTKGSRISGDRYFEYDLYWGETEDGWVLKNEDGVIHTFYGGEELIPRT